MNDSTSAISPAWPTRWPKNSFKSVWTWLLAAFIAALFVLAFIGGIRMAPVSNVTPLLFDEGLALQFVFEGILLAIVLATLPAMSKFSLRELGFRPLNGRTVLIAMAGAITMTIVANGSASLIDYLAHSRHEQDIVQIFKGIHSPTTTVLFVTFAVIFAPFAEETFFRIFFFNLGLRYGGFWCGAILSGILFGIAHGDLYAALPLALGGMILCAVYYVSRNAYASMISHALFNGVSIVALLVAPKSI